MLLAIVVQKTVSIRHKTQTFYVAAWKKMVSAYGKLETGSRAKYDA